jgi:N-methylhydantoinase B
VTVELDGVEIKDSQNSKIRGQQLRTGDRLFLRAGGGGGFGPPVERELALVARDVKQGYISAQSARDNYRVSLSSDFKIQQEETRALRGDP